MRNQFIKLTTIFTAVVISLFLVTTSFSCKRELSKETNPIPPASEEVKANYLNYCAGCHGENLEVFRNRKWLHGMGKENLFKSTKFGLLDEGMPAFKDGLSDDQINALVDYIQDELTREIKEDKKAEFPKIIKSEVQKFGLEMVTDGLDVPWGMEFLLSGELLISERNGNLFLLNDQKVLQPVEGLPEILSKGQGGLMDIELHPDYVNNGWIYFAYSSPDPGDKNSANTAVLRAKLNANKLTDIEKIFQALPYSTRGHHWGSKLEFDNDGYLYFSVGDRGARDQNPQSLANHCGKIHRIFDDGRIPPDNPFVGTPGATPTIYSYGHRNPQGVAKHPVTGDIWTSEHGPKGGDELNIIQAANNYGWPIITFGINYSGTIITKDTAKAGMEQPLLYWTPSIAPCGMTFVKGTKYKGWKNSLLLGSLRFEYLKRCEVVDDKVVHQENLLENIGRVRNVEMSPDGYIYVAVEKPGKIYRLVPIE